MKNSRFRPWVFGSFAGFSAVLAVWIVFDPWRADLPPGPTSEAEPGPEIAEPTLAAPDKAIKPAAVSGPDPGFVTTPAGTIPYYKTKEQQRGQRNHPDVTANSSKDRTKALSRLAELGYKPWEAEELRTLWDDEMAAFDQELERRRRADPERSLSMDRRLLEREAYANLREKLDPADYAAVRYSAEKTTRIEVYSVSSGTLEEELGLWPGDQLFSYEGERLFDINQYMALTEAEIDRSRAVILGFRRGGSEFFVEIPGGNIQIPLLGVVAPP